MANTIKNILSKEILDSRGNPTLETTVALADGAVGTAAVPSGASTGSHEALELRDGDTARFDGKGVLKAIGNVTGEIAKALQGKSWEQKNLDETLIALDGTENKNRLGANAILSVSLAFGKAAAKSGEQEFFEYLREISGIKEPPSLPMPFVNILNGGRHAKGGTDFQEYLIVPAGASNFEDAVRICALVYKALQKTLEDKNYSLTLGDEGGFAPRMKNNEEPLKILMGAIEKTSFRAGKDINLAIDVAATELYENGRYNLTLENRRLSAEELIAEHEKLVKTYPIISIEDGLTEDDWNGWQKLTAALGQKIELVGDDIFSTNEARLQMGAERSAGNAILIKPNQVGTITETIDTVLAAKKAGYKTMASHRSGETKDPFIAHFAVGLAMGQIKAGAMVQKERLTKYNELIRIEKILKTATPT